MLPWVAGEYWQVISRYVFKALPKRVSLYCCKANQGQCPSRVSLRNTNYNSSKGPKHKHRVTEPPTAQSTAQPSMPALGTPASKSNRCSPARPLQSSLWLGTSTPFRWLSPALELLHPYPAPSLLKGAGNWMVDGTGALLREKWDKFGEISSLSGNSSLIYWGLPSKDALLLHPPPGLSLGARLPP